MNGHTPGFGRLLDDYGRAAYTGGESRDHARTALLAVHAQMLEALLDAAGLIMVVIAVHQRRGESNSERVATRTLANIRAAISAAEGRTTP